MTEHPLFPVPKVLIPSIVGATGIVAAWIVSGEFNREELAALFSLTVYAVIGWVVPDKRKANG